MTSFVIKNDQKLTNLSVSNDAFMSGPLIVSTLSHGVISSENVTGYFKY